MFCRNCGKEVNDNAVVCVSCGAAVKPQSSKQDGPIGCLLGGACFLVPIIGLVLYLMWKDEMPQKAKQAGIWAIVGFVLNLIFSVIYFVAVMSEGLMYL